jgi:F-type H+-transporting ATPase subunit alpha
MSNLLQEIEAQITGVKTSVAKQNVGTVREIGDGVAKIDGLTDAMLNEMLDFGNGVTGLALNLEETEVGAIILGDYTGVKEGQEVRTTGKLLQVPVGKGLLGRVVNALGQSVDGKGPVKNDTSYPVEKIAPGIIRRKSVSQPVQTGIMAIDAMIPIGRGQRELIIGDRSTGKTTIGIDTIISNARLNKAAEAAGDKEYRPLYSIYVAVGQKQSNIARVISVLEEAGAMPYTIVVAASASDSATNQYLAPFAGCAMGEWFMDNAMDALIIYDDLSKHAVAYRQVSLVLKRPSGREAYPGDVFYLHSRLLERSARLNEKYGNGSLTALPIIETQLGDVSAYIPTNVISITDGQIYLETDLFYQGVRPAISVGLSVSRVGSAAQIKAMKQVAGRIKLDLAQFRELAAFAQFGSDLDAATQAKIERGKRIVEVFKQPQYNPISVEAQAAVLWAAQNGYFDDVAVEKVKDCQNKLTEYLTTRKSQLTAKIAKEKTLSDALAAELKTAVMEFKQTYR